MSGTLTKTESTLRFFDNPHFVEYERGLLELMRLISDGLGDSSEAEALRDKMESAWRELDSAEIARLDGLSADLFALEKQSIPSHGDTSSEGMAVAEVRHAWEREDWDGLLRALRSHSLPFRPDFIAHFRSRAYASLGHLDAALEFALMAAELNPKLDGLALGAAYLMLSARRIEQAVAYLLPRIASPECDPEVRVHGAAILFLSTRDLPDDVKRERSGEAVEILRESLDKLEISEGGSLNLEVQFGYLTLALCFDALGDEPEAQKSINRLIEIDPKLGDAYAIRGEILWDSAPDSALADFEKAVELGTEAVIPYLVLASEAAGSKKYQRCIQLCNGILELSPKPRHVAWALQWIAISRFELGDRNREVLWLMHRAQALDPLNAIIAHNAEVLNQRFMQPKQQGSFELSIPAVMIAELKREQQNQMLSGRSSFVPGAVSSH